MRVEREQSGGHAAVLSRAMRELWGQRDGVRRGPKPAMSVRAIATAAADLADTDGLDAVTMAALARRMGFTTMSLYRYVDSRQDLLEVMVDEALGEPPELDRTEGWRSQVAAWARAEGGRFLAHPWALSIRLDSPPVGPYSVGWMEAGFIALQATGLGPQQVASSLLAVDGYVRSSVQVSLQYLSGPAADSWADQLRAVLTDGAMPAVRAVLDSGALEDGDAGDDEFTFGLNLLLDGIERRAEQTRRAVARTR
ncbi:TetR/AcrR family transcriptional regulator C-terminal domain-containing protein [Nocardioides hankookensis]|uniref:TetR/AcrR family transcriptional regulator n=1 Tax=Nocardioides hankookensis TaxID=443157 RepID=A0ABW1LLJ0_9ACTN